MHKNKLWLVFLGFFSLLTFWFLLSAGIQFYHYQSLSETVELKPLRWSIRKEDGWYYPHLTALYQVGEREFQLEENLTAHWARNSWSAEQTAQKLASEPLQAYYSTHAPEKATTNRSFPLKIILKSLALLLLLLYFFWLGMHVAKIPS